jgi:hypothetical protein
LEKCEARGKWLRAEQHYDGQPSISVSAEMRYKGQSFDAGAVQVWIGGFWRRVAV